MNYFNNDTLIYNNGEFVKAVDAKIDLYSQSLHYGSSLAIFRHALGKVFWVVLVV